MKKESLDFSNIKETVDFIEIKPTTDEPSDGYFSLTGDEINHSVHNLIESQVNKSVVSVRSMMGAFDVADIDKHNSKALFSIAAIRQLSKIKRNINPKSNYAVIEMTANRGIALFDSSEIKHPGIYDTSKDAVVPKTGGLAELHADKKAVAYVNSSGEPVDTKVKVFLDSDGTFHTHGDFDSVTNKNCFFQALVEVKSDANGVGEIKKLYLMPAKKSDYVRLSKLISVAEEMAPQYFGIFCQIVSVRKMVMM